MSKSINSETKTYYQVKLINYFDVWGDKKDGYEVNDLCTEFEDVYINDNSDRSILNMLKLTCMIKETCRINQLTFDRNSFENAIEIYERVTKKPMFLVEFMEK